MIILPLFHQMTEAEQDRVAWSLQQACVAREKTTLNNYMKPLSKHKFVAGLFIIVLVLYVYPFAATMTALKSSVLPPEFGPDLYLYLNLSQLRVISPGVVRNPWYGIQVPTSEVAYRKFGLAFALFAHLVELLRHDLMHSTLVWNLIWTSLIFVMGYGLFREVLSPNNEWIFVASLALLMLLDFKFLPAIASAWVHILSPAGFERFGLPYARAFFPQVAVPFILLYLLLQIRASDNFSWATLLVMAVIQFLSFTMYPFATLLMAGTTAILLLVTLIWRVFPVNYGRMVIFGLLCGAMDWLFVASGPPPSNGGHLLAISPAWLLRLLPSKTLLLTVIVTVGVGFIRDPERPQVKWTLFAFGFTVTLLQIADAFVSPALQVAHHSLYLVHTALAVLVAYILASLYRSFRRVAFAKTIPATVVGLVVLHGALTARGEYRSYFPQNKALSEMADLVRSLNLEPDDLVVVRARDVDDGGWIPLVSPAQVLFCRNAEFVVTPYEELNIHVQRQLLYLYLTGKDEAWVRDVLSDKGPPDWQAFLAMTKFRLSLEGPRRRATLDSLRQELLPRMQQLNTNSTEATLFFRQYKRILVIDTVQAETFSKARLDRHLVTSDVNRSGQYEYFWAKPL